MLLSPIFSLDQNSQKIESIENYDRKGYLFPKIDFMISWRSEEKNH